MTITVDQSAPNWANQMARSTERAIEGEIWPYVTRDVLTITTLPSAASFPYMKVRVSNGAGNKFEVISNGTAWYYLEGTAV